MTIPLSTNSVRQVTGAQPALALALALLSFIGCSRSGDRAAKAPRPASTAGLDLVHSVGSIIEGTKVEHAFVTKNHFSVPIVIATDADVGKTCGCTTLEPSARRLAPGEHATIRMRVDTTGKNGPFRVGGHIRWRLENGEPWPVNLLLEGTAKPILTARPALVQFSPTDIAEQKTKELLVFNSFDVDWPTLRVHVEPRCVELVETIVSEDHAKLLLRPRLASEVCDFSVTLRCTANLVEARGDVTQAVISVPVQGRQDVDLQVSPRVVFASWSASLKRGTARFLVRALVTAVPGSISSISCDGFRAGWNTKDISPVKAKDYRTLQVELKLSEPDDPAFDSTQARRVRIAFAGGRVVEVPVYFVAHHERS